jgi:hypothetical protein
MPRTRAQAKIADDCGAGSPLLCLPMETRLQIYGHLLLVDFCDSDRRRTSDKPDNTVDNDTVDNDAIDDNAADNDAIVDNAADNNAIDDNASDNNAVDNGAAPEEPSTQRPTYDSRQVYRQLLLVCKMIHTEAAPLFYSKVTFFVKEPFKFANQFLRLLPAYKITSIRHLELRLLWQDFRYVNYILRAKVLNDLITVFKTYPELSNLNSLSLIMHGRVLYGWNQVRYLDFRPFEAHGAYYSSTEILNCVWNACRALAHTMATARFDISEHMEDVKEKNAGIENALTRNVVVKVKVQRKE